jgi:hypothetical protein
MLDNTSGLPLSSASDPAKQSLTKINLTLRENQEHSCRSEDALAQKGRQIKAEGRGDRSKKRSKKSLKTKRIWPH